MVHLPVTNELGFYEIRLESIGGLGANLAGKMLAEAGVLGLGLNGANFASYGSEKKGSPVKSFVRFCAPNKEIRDHSPIERPHVIGVFHEALYKMVDVVSGLEPDGIVLVNSTRDFEEVKEDLKISHGTLAIVDALKIANEEKTRINTAMLGALFRICDFLDPEVMRDVIRNTFSKKYPHLVDSNLHTFDRGFAEVRFHHYESKTGTIDKGWTQTSPKFGYKTQAIGGIIPANANSLQRDLTASRVGFLPSWDVETCIHCAMCDTVCPDFCFVWEEGEDKRGRSQMFLQGIDYQYCKGCMKCVEICPTGSLVKMLETRGYASENRTPHNIPMIKEGE